MTVPMPLDTKTHMQGAQGFSLFVSGCGAVAQGILHEYLHSFGCTGCSAAAITDDTGLDVSEADASMKFVIGSKRLIVALKTNPPVDDSLPSDSCELPATLAGQFLDVFAAEDDEGIWYSRADWVVCWQFSF
jgi:hypothetical protein